MTFSIWIKYRYNIDINEIPRFDRSIDISVWTAMTATPLSISWLRSTVGGAILY